MNCTLDMIVVSYHEEAYIERLIEDAKLLTRSDYVIHHWNNTGNKKTVSAAWNELAAIGRGEYLAVLNADIALSPGWDERLISCLNSDSSIGFAAADAAPFSIEMPSREQMVSIAAERAEVVDLRRTEVQFHVPMMKRATWNELGGVDERMRFYMQDIDFVVRLSERLKKSAVRVLKCPIWHKGSSATVEARKRGELNPDFECKLGSDVFTEVRHGRMKEWHQLTHDEKMEIRQDPRYNNLKPPGDSKL